MIRRSLLLPLIFLIGGKALAQTAETRTLKEIISATQGKFLLGATFDFQQLGTPAEVILLREFNYTVPENSAKQTVVHPRPNVWRWGRIDSLVEMATKNNLVIRLHGPIGPQCSKWTKDDKRTKAELSVNLDEFMLEQCRRFNGNRVVQMMDVVNETVTLSGEWFGPKEGSGKWENPWTKLGVDSDKNKTPLYILRAFEIASANAPSIQLIYNQHGGMERAMWDRVKETILYVRSKGLRVDGIGWQAHLSSDRKNYFDAKALDDLSSLIDWAHQNKLGFHVTEIDFKIVGPVNDMSLKEQAEGYAAVLEVLLSKRNTGTVTFNTWGVHDAGDENQFLFDSNLLPKPGYFATQKTLIRN